MENSADYPRYPALPRCMVLESSFAIRARVLKSLEAVELFQEVIEAKSVKDGLEKLRLETYDLCIIGSSVSEEAVTEFLKKGVAASKSQNCGFVKLVQAGDTSLVMAELPAEVHGLVEYPCPNSQFFDGIVLAVVKANARSPWAKVTSKKLQHDTATTTKDRKPAGPVRSLINLQHIVRGYESGIYGLTENGQLTLTTRTALSAVTELFLGTQQRVGALADFKIHFNAALNIWFKDLVLIGQDDATKNLKLRLQKYTRHSQRERPTSLN